MYSRAIRNVGSNEALGSSHVGPGTYDTVTFDNPKKNALDSYAPFLSLSLRDDIYSSINETPGPGKYDLRRTQTHIIKGGSSLSNKAQRFTEKQKENPGPGSYIIENKENKSQNIETRISKQRVKFSRKKNAPSIQDPKHAYGFEESANGELIPQAAPERDPTIGPAYYHGFGSGSQQSQYKGTNFGKSSSKRTNFAGNSEGPGPGEYDTMESTHVDVEHYHLKNSMDKKPELNLPRYPEALIKNVQKESTPGPTKYDQKRLFDEIPTNKFDMFGIEAERPPFGTQSKRFDASKPLQPGPGTYNDQRTSLTSLQRLHGIKQTPFSQSSIRFEATQSRSAPGPGQYRINGFAEDNLRRAIIESRRKPAFGQSEERKYNLTKKDESQIPGPAQYTLKEKPFRPKRENGSSNFVSQVKKHEVYFEDTPGPTAYDVPKAYDHLVNARREAPRNKMALTRQESFNVVSKRVFNIALGQENPGPGTYDQGILKSKNTYYAKINDSRWKPNKNDGPGPSDYELSPMYQDTILKGTFNATLNNPLVFKSNKDGSNSVDSSRLSTIHHGSTLRYSGGLANLPEQQTLQIS